MKLSIKKDKASFYHVEGWIAKYDYERKDKIYNLLSKPPGQPRRRIRENPFNLKNWNSPNNEYPMILEFKDPFLGMKFLLQMSEHVEKTL